MRPLILMPTINSRNSNACYLQLLSVQRCQHPPAAESALDPAPASRPLGSCLSGTLEAVVFTAPSSPIHLRAVECWRFTKDL